MPEVTTEGQRIIKLIITLNINRIF